MAKLARESRLRERRLEKQARKLARKDAAAQPRDEPDEAATPAAGDETPSPVGSSDVEPIGSMKPTPAA